MTPVVTGELNVDVVENPRLGGVGKFVSGNYLVADGRQGSAIVFAENHKRVVPRAFAPGGKTYTRDGADRNESAPSNVS